MPRRLSGRAALRILVLLAGWVVFVATSNIDRTFAELELEGAIPVREGHGEASVVFELDGFYVDARAEVAILVSSRADLPAPPGRRRCRGVLPLH